MKREKVTDINLQRRKCRNCGKVRQRRFMNQFVALIHGVAVADLYPENVKNKIEWECGDCEEENRGRFKL